MLLIRIIPQKSKLVLVAAEAGDAVAVMEQGKFVSYARKIMRSYYSLILDFAKFWLTALLCLATTTFANDAETYTKRGEELFRQNEFGKAITELNQAIQLDPNNAVAYFIRGYAYLNRSEYNQAISDLTQAIQLNPNNPAVYYVRGNAYREKDEHDKACVGKCTPKGNEYSEKAIADFEAVLRLDPDNAEAKEKLGKIRRRTKQ